MLGCQYTCASSVVANQKESLYTVGRSLHKGLVRISYKEGRTKSKLADGFNARQLCVVGSPFS